jgi:hypothetical protein
VSKSSVVRRGAGVAAAFIAMSAGLVIGSGSANAAPASSHTVDYSCKIPVIGTKVVGARLSVSAPAKATAGKSVKVGLSFSATGLPSVAVTDVNVKSSLSESGAQKGSVSLTEHLASGNTGTLNFSMAGSVKLAKAGKVELTAGSSASFSLTTTIIGKISVTCTATTKKLPVLATISVSKASHKSTTGADWGKLN